MGISIPEVVVPVEEGSFICLGSFSDGAVFVGAKPAARSKILELKILEGAG